MTGLVLALVLVGCGVSAFVAYWMGVGHSQERVRGAELAALRADHLRMQMEHRYVSMQALNQQLAHEVSRLRMRESFDRIVEDGWAS